MVRLEISGRASKDGTNRKAGDYDVGSCGIVISVAGSKRDTSDVLFIDLTSFGPMGNRLRDLKKGTQIYAVCTGKTRSWDGKDGKKQYRTEWTPVFLEVLSTPGPKAESTASKNDEDEDEAESDDIPF